MARRSAFTREFREKTAAEFAAAPDKGAFAKRTGIGASTLHRWAKARRPAGRPPGRRTSAPAPAPSVPAVSFDGALIAYAAIDDALLGLPGDVARSVLAAQLRRRGGPPA
jgi:hypothetical protein